MLTNQSSPETFYSRFVHVATNTAKDIQEFSNLIKGDRSQEVLKKAKKSRDEHPEGIRGWMVNEHPDWLEIKSEDVILDPVVGNEITSAKKEIV